MAHASGSARRSLLLVVAVSLSSTSTWAAESLDKKGIIDLADRWFAARPATRFVEWNEAERAPLLEEARAMGRVPEGSLEKIVEWLWKEVRDHAPRAAGEIETPYGPASWIQKGRGGPRAGLLIGLHGGGEGAGDAGEAAGSWTAPGHMGMYPQGVRLVGDTWNSVHGERFVLTLIEIAKARHEVDPDRVYVMGFSMGGTGSWHMAGRHPDLFAGAVPAHGVVMARPGTKLRTKDEVEAIQYGLVPNVRNLAVWFYTGSDDRNCEPGTFCYVWDRIEELRAEDPGGWKDVRFTRHEGIAHAFPPREPRAGIDWVTERRRDAYPKKIVWEYAAEPYPLPDAEDRVARIEKRWFYWLRCLRPVDAMHVVAQREGNEFDLSVSLADPADFEIHLHPSMIDVEKDVVVRVDGEEVYRGRPVPDFVTILESLDAKLDRRMVFDRRIEIP